METTAVKEQNGSHALISIGLVVEAGDSQVESWAEWLSEELARGLAADFPGFEWRFLVLRRHDFPRALPKDPLLLLEFGSDVKIEYNLDFVLVLTSYPLKARFEQGINGVPSNLLETGVVTVAKIMENRDPGQARDAVLALSRHVLGHLWGLDHDDHTVMKPRKFWTGQGPVEWGPEEKRQIEKYLKEVADPRLEETTRASRSKWRFYLQVLAREKSAIARDIFLFRSWLMMLHLGRFIAATAVSVIFLFLSAEAWEMGAAIQSVWLDFVLAGVILAATLSLYYGQNLQGIASSDRMMEQAVRSRIVLFGTLAVGMFAFWVTLVILSTGIIYLFPDTVLLGWAGLKAGTDLPVFHYAKLMATFGILASAVGGNLEEEQDIKAVLVYTEET